MLLKAAISAPRPMSPDEVAADARACFEAGAGAIHAHVRNAGGEESLEPDDVAALVTRTENLGCPLGISTGAWIVPDPAVRLAKIRAWTVVPQFASVNFSEDGAVDVARTLLAKGVGVEAGLAFEHDAAVLIESGLAERCLRILLEPQEPDVAAALKTVAAIEARLAGMTLPRVLHGTGPTAWPLFDEAVRRGLGARAGLEDMRALPDGSPATENAAIVRAARERARLY